MATDHFKKYARPVNSLDWNFNILFDNQPQVAKMVEQYKPLLQHPEWHEPIPASWLHMTILRAGYTTDFSDEEMMGVARILSERLKAVTIPELTFGESWLWSGNVVLPVLPVKPVEQIYNAVIKSIKDVVGSERAPTPDKFIPHVTLVYTKDNDAEAQMEQRLKENPIKPASFHPISVDLIKQKQGLDFYTWEVVRRIRLH